MLAAAALIALGQVAVAKPPPAPPPPLVAPSLTPVRTPTAPVIDGDLSDPVWQLAQPITAFTQKFPLERAEPSERTTLRVLYDDDAIYVAFDCEQTSVPVISRMARRDRDVESDSVSIDIDSRALGKTAFEFSVNAAGVLRDGIRSNDVIDSGDRYSSSWDENWDARTSVRAGGWSAEIRIPLRVLRFSATDLQTWGFQARRYTSMRQEIDEWSHVPRNVASEVSLYGHLDAMRMRPRSDLELRPFVLGRLQRRDRTELTLDHGFSPKLSGGLDLRWHLTSNFTLDGTINPDFTQVEGDELYLNLSNFESFYPEKRPFFVEGSDIFESPAPLSFARSFLLLYTRRIGGRPDVPTLRPTGVFDDRLVTLTEPSTILGATKLVGRLGKSWSVGAMSAITAANTVQVQDKNGVRNTQLVDPTTMFEALRLKHDFEGGKAHIGFLGTAVARAETTSEYPTYVPAGARAPRSICPNGDEQQPGTRCTHDAYVGSVDGLWRSENGEIFLSGQGIASVIDHGPPRTLRDGTVVASGDAGYGAQLLASREGGSGLAWNAQYQHASRKLDFNDLGFMERQDQHYLYGNFEYRTFEPIGPTTESHTWFEVANRYNLDLVKVQRRWLVDQYLRYKSFWGTYVELNYEEPKFDDREIGNGMPFERPGRPGIVLQANTDRRRDLYVETAVAAQKFPGSTGGGGNVEYRIRGLIRAHPQLELELVPTVTHTSGETRFAELGVDPTQMIFGNLVASSFATTARVSFTITPRLSLQAFGQIFLASGHYEDLRSFTMVAGGAASQKIRLDALTPTAAPAVNPDFLDVSLNVNVVVRWEYSLGSVLYLVFNRTQAPATTLVLDQDQSAALSLGALSRAPAVDTLLLKWQLFVNL